MESGVSSSATTQTPTTPNDDDEERGDAKKLEELLDTQVRQALERARNGDDVYKKGLAQIVEDAWSLLRA